MAVTAYQELLRDRFLAAPVVAPPPPWQPVGRGLIPVGGLLGIGFATAPATGHDLVLTVSGSGHGLFDAVTGEKLEREYDPGEEPDGPQPAGTTRRPRPTCGRSAGRRCWGLSDISQAAHAPGVTEPVPARGPTAGTARGRTTPYERAERASHRRARTGACPSRGKRGGGMSALDFEVIDSPDSSLNKTSVLVTGPDDALLVDAGFTRSDGRRLVERIRACGKRLTTVFVSHGDPDFYFGAQEVQDAFPQARFLATATTVEHIQESYEGKLKAWAHLGPELPTRLVRPEVLHSDELVFEGHRFELRGADFHLPDRHYLWQHHHRTILGGVLLFEGLHVWTADTPTPEQRAAWIDLLDGMQALQPGFVVAGHRRAGAPTITTAIDHTRAYLRAFETEIGRATDAAAAKEALERRFPDLGMKLAVDLGTKVAKGEMAWG
ncbi:MBL fold metallo-hydrolase [Kitasatospora sp. NBC_00039]|uniref:MBL fold metallo-hydrolase n=2 Tax=Kitasatospora TaxID=2063 RepID=UPI00386C84A4